LQIISSIRYRYSVKMDGSSEGRARVVLQTSANLFDANIFQMINVNVKNKGTLVYQRSFSDLGQWIIEIGGTLGKNEYIFPINGQFDEIEIATTAGFGPN